jgi:hypothetical protein
MKLDKKDNFIPLSKDAKSGIDQIIDDLKEKANVPPNTTMQIIDKKDEPDGSETISFSYTGEYPIKPHDMNQEIMVSTPLTAEVRLNKQNDLVEYRIHDPEPSMISALESEVETILKTGEIEKEFYIQKDEQGKQHLKRAYLSLILHWPKGVQIFPAVALMTKGDCHLMNYRAVLCISKSAYRIIAAKIDL